MTVNALRTAVGICGITDRLVNFFNSHKTPIEVCFCINVC